MNTILFDLDGTLIDSSEGIIKCVLYTLDFYGIKEPDTAKLYRFIGPPDESPLVLKDIMDFRMKKRMRLCRNTGNGTIRPVFLSVSYIRVWRSVSVH